MGCYGRFAFVYLWIQYTLIHAILSLSPLSQVQSEHSLGRSGNGAAALLCSEDISLHRVGDGIV